MIDLLMSPDFYRYCVRCTPEGCLDIVLACAADGELFWRKFFEHGLVDAIAESSRLERRFFNLLCIDSIALNGGPILDDYIGRLTAENLARFFSSDELKNKNHPLNHVYAAARQKTPTGSVALGMLGTFIHRGLQGNLLLEVAERRHQDVMLACRAGNAEFLVYLFTRLNPVPPRLLIYVVGEERHGAELVSKLISEDSVPLVTFTKPKLLRYATNSVRELIGALQARNERVPSQNKF